MGAGLRIVPGYLDREAQERLLAAIRDVVALAPLYTPRMPRNGQPMSVRMTNCGPLGWMTDEQGYRYQGTHPVTGAPWPPIPAILIEAWRELAGYPPTAAGLPRQFLRTRRPHAGGAIPPPEINTPKTDPAPIPR